MGTNKTKKLPELLSPAGSMDAFKAAIDGGADAIYIGGSAFNARINAKNFDAQELCEAVKLAHTYGVKVYQTINTMIYDRELDELLRSAEASAIAGVDAFIVSDVGAARLLRQRLPEMALHASTQMSVHNSAGVEKLLELGFSRVVPARELSREDIAKMVRNSGMEIEIFVHGALCVSHSGQCLFSSLVGGRSGNRGLCAQPCRLPYGCGDKSCEKYPLSLKDLSLASYVNEIIDSGVASLKIEGRMKSPEYVGGVTRVWRRLLDEGRDASGVELRELAELFSRGGFTDGYYTKTVGRSMLGIRSESDKQASRDIAKFNKITRKVPINMAVKLSADQAASLMLTHGERSVTVFGDVASAAINAPLDKNTVVRCMSKLGDTPFEAASVDVNIDGNVMMPISALNALRRQGAAELFEKISQVSEAKIGEADFAKCNMMPHRANIARFYRAEQITEGAKDFFDAILLPLEQYVNCFDVANGFFMPPVILDGEWDQMQSLLKKAAQASPKYAVAANIGQLETLKCSFPDTKIIADFRFNVANGQTAAYFEGQGVDSFVLSPELTLPQMRDVSGSKSAIVYGRIPLMTLEKCAIKELYGDKKACAVCAENQAKMTDRRGVTFSILREWQHRNVVYNSLPTGMSDKLSELERAGIVNRHFIFTVESADEVDGVIKAYQKGQALDCKVRRI
ncbi:MAG: U32 family peptidase [Clostridia bacterium]|nr:U32 family peptidase [Clostridia bacterium]